MLDNGPVTDPATFFGYDFEFRPGEPTDIAGNAEAQAAARRFRDVLGRFCTGLAVVTSTYDGEPVGLTCQSFASVSLEPPLVMFVPARTSRAWPVIHRAGRFCANFLGRDQEDVATVMASKGADKFAGVGWQPSPRLGTPLLDGVLGYVDCTVQAVHEAGDHYVVIGRVHDLAVSDEAGDPLLYFEGRYRSLS